jgi:hypothetical protein
VLQIHGGKAALEFACLNYFQLLLVFDVASTILCALYFESESTLFGT